MKFVRYNAGGSDSYGILDGEIVKEISGPGYSDYSETGATHSLGDVKLLAPALPKKMLAMALNYGSHLHDAPAPERPEAFFKTHTSLVGTGDTIKIPTDSEKVDAEAELVVVIGKTASNVSLDDAMDYVFGYSCGNDVSARDWQASDTSWWRAKSSDTFSPIGPWIVTGIDPSSLDIEGRINGVAAQNCNTSEMIHNIPKTISFISKYVTLEPGDCIFTGTSGTAGQIKAGDTVEVEISQVGTLTNICG
ncbi:MAG: fumarylacetoacetate hydrolase family protein [Chloroflexi bacterium]|nr:fumarylacetoacetate hydrolase family protein [Chloroflexota bacterium]